MFFCFTESEGDGVSTAVVYTSSHRQPSVSLQQCSFYKTSILGKYIVHAWVSHKLGFVHYVAISTNFLFVKQQTVTHSSKNPYYNILIFSLLH